MSAVKTKRVLTVDRRSVLLMDWQFNVIADVH